ncbi:hypothetical protein [Vibrio sp. B1ASS3]|uniref:hypothetical protein n=1 Tax=Vibrio sp. B1ASS3 TaxID=2751176 RepID=UPI001ABADAA8|nr:hypothetical protein [Vibrio sp. B1ASS3]
MVESDARCKAWTTVKTGTSEIPQSQLCQIKALKEFKERMQMLGNQTQHSEHSFTYIFEP